MCPYARFQSAMFDRDTLVITYDTKRGEPRGPRSRHVDAHAKGLGDCIDCTLCVQACPTGIDIREGLQYECIACAACIDACDSVMDKVGYPRGLIRYTTENAVDGKTARVVRPRIVVYATLLLVLLSAGVIGLSLRKSVSLDILRDRNALYREVGSDRIENVYVLKILNKDPSAHDYRVSISGITGAELISDQAQWHVGGGEVYSIAVRVDVPVGGVHGGHDLMFSVTDVANPDRHVVEKARFIAP
jgi:cytochrome c oxidase accessory protein FixG